MNLLEQYIIEVHSVKKVKLDWGSFIEVDLTIDSYGGKKRKTTSFPTMEDWKKVKKQGYYMA